MINSVLEKCLSINDDKILIYDFVVRLKYVFNNKTFDTQSWQNQERDNSRGKAYRFYDVDSILKKFSDHSIIFIINWKKCVCVPTWHSGHVNYC